MPSAPTASRTAPASHGARVLIYDLASGRRVARHEAAEALQLNDVAVAADGTLYVTDSAAGSMFRMRPGETTLTLFGTARAARGANGIAVAPDGTVYVTLSTGIGRVDPRDGSLVRLAQPDSVVSGGIDGLYWHDGDLVGVQNSTNPGRVDPHPPRRRRHAHRRPHGPAIAPPSGVRRADHRRDRQRQALCAREHARRSVPGDGTIKDPADS